MRIGSFWRLALTLLACLGLTSCGPPRDEIPPRQLASVMRAHYQGLGSMERYEYASASESFREVHRLAPGWSTGSINLAIALLNQGGEAKEKAKNGGEGAVLGVALRNIDEAQRLLEEVLTTQPENPWAHFCRGIILRDKGDLINAHRDFQNVVDVDPSDANAWLELGLSLTDPERNNMPASNRQAQELIAIYSKSLECNPYLFTAMFRLSFALRWSGDTEGQRKLLATSMNLDPRKNPAASGDFAALVYGEMGRYARIIEPFAVEKATVTRSPLPRFEPPTPIQVTLPPGNRWVTSTDFQGPMAVIGRARSRFGAGVATFDADGDGRIDLYLTSAVVGPEGVHDVLLRNLGNGKFADVTTAFGLPGDRAGLGVAAGDFDADRRVDLFLTGVGDNRLYRNLGKGFEDVTNRAGITGTPAVSLTARWLDLDQDGDLDLYVINHARAKDSSSAFDSRNPPPGLINFAFRNDGQAAMIGKGDRPESNWAPMAVATEDLPATAGLSIAFSTGFPGLVALQGNDDRHTAIAALDIDEDRDIDLVLATEARGPVVVLNDRMGNFHVKPLLDLKAETTIDGLLVMDQDKDGRPDLVASGQGGATTYRNATSRPVEGLKLKFESSPIARQVWRLAQAVDLDLDTWIDVVGLPNPDPSLGMAWGRNMGSKVANLVLPVDLEPGFDRPLQGFAVADLVGDALPDLVTIRDGQSPNLARNLGNGNHWLAVDLSGRWKFSFDQMRTNSHGLGARLSLEGQGLSVPYDHTSPSSGLGQSVGPVVLGMGSSTSAPLLRIRWPDGVMQCELNVTADKVMPLVELNRKTGSCPVLFTWNGTRFECLGDFLGGGGLGYLVSPGLYGQPDRDESVAIAPDQLKPIDGVYRLSVVEPMDEVAYLDKLTLDVIDRRPGVSSTPDERFAPEGLRPTGEVLAWSRTIEPIKATDHEGRDVTASVRNWDRNTVDQFARLQGWIGYTMPHSLILDFGDRLRDFPRGARPVLCLAGWVEYPYSQTNYAASTAGVALKPPILERLRDDGTWEVVDPHPGYPAGLPRMMTVDLSGKVDGPRCVVRLSTNMECYWDQAFVAVVGRSDSTSIRSTSLPVARASLGDRGYLREGSPDGRLPLLYEYDHVDPAPLARMEGFLTRHGEVTGLLGVDDDQVCTVGPGDELRLEFDTASLPELPSGWTRAYVLRAVGYCKDADPFTALSDSVGPLPWRGMPEFPFGDAGVRPLDPAYSTYLREFQTRPAGVR